MEPIFNVFENTLVLKKSYKFDFKKLLISYQLKRFLLNSLFGFINIIILFFGTQYMIASHFETFWVASLGIYIFCYWLISSIIIDKLIGDEIDYQLSK